jgi:hypothetical protein
VWQQARERAEQQLRQQDVARAELEGLTAYCRRVAGNLRTFDFDERRQALEALDVRVSASGRDAKLEWSVPTGDKQAVPVHLY